MDEIDMCAFEGWEDFPVDQKPIFQCRDIGVTEDDYGRVANMYPCTAQELRLAVPEPHSIEKLHLAGLLFSAGLTWCDVKAVMSIAEPRTSAENVIRMWYHSVRQALVPKFYGLHRM